MTRPLPTKPEDLLTLLQKIGVRYGLYHHSPTFSVAESAPLKKEIPGMHCRNLFLRDKKQAMFLVVARDETAIDLKKLARLLGCGRLSFGSPERLMRCLGIRPGSVCPFCALNDREKAVTIVLDAGMMNAETVNFHPLDNRMTIGLSPAHLLRFFEHTGHIPRIEDLTPAAPAPD